MSSNKWQLRARANHTGFDSETEAESRLILLSTRIICIAVLFKYRTTMLISLILPAQISKQIWQCVMQWKKKYHKQGCSLLENRKVATSLCVVRSIPCGMAAYLGQSIGIWRPEDDTQNSVISFRIDRFNCPPWCTHAGLPCLSVSIPQYVSTLLTFLAAGCFIKSPKKPTSV